MLGKVIVNLIAVFIQISSASKVCYEQNGSRQCFSNDEAPFQALPLPQDPTSDIAPSFHLYRSLSTAMGGYARRIIDSAKELRNLAENGLILIIHGWTGDFPNTELWQSPMIRNILSVKPETDVLHVEWSRGASLKFGSDPYAQPAANTRSIAWVVTKFLMGNENFDPSKAHCIGLSVGAHICGFVGKLFSLQSASQRPWGRISGLDPAYPYFDMLNPIGRLDRTDAIFVDVIHTSKLGLERPVGHVDFYVSGGIYQPSCANRPARHHRHKRHNALTNFVEQFTQSIEDLFACSHLRAAVIFGESIMLRRNETSTSPAECNNMPTFCPCSSLVDFSRGKCSTCSEKDKHVVGYWCAERSDKTGSYFGEVSNDKLPPLCTVPIAGKL